MGNKWLERDRKLSTRNEHKRLGGRFKHKEIRNKTKGKQRKEWNVLRKINEDEDVE